MKGKLTALAAMVIGFAMSSAAIAQTRGELSRFDTGYLDQHPEIAHQLGRNPDLVDNPQYLANHPGLDEYLATHRNVRAELQAHPERFMNDEWRYGAASGFAHGYLDEHPEVARQLGQNPNLVNNPHYLATHPGLDDYLATHPNVRTHLQQHPERFMSDEWRWDLQPRGHGKEGGITRGEVSGFDQSYLNQHPEVERQLGQNPGLADDPHFLATHPGLDSYLAAHPGVRTQLQAHPGTFMTEERRREHRERRHRNGS